MIRYSDPPSLKRIQKFQQKSRAKWAKKYEKLGKEASFKGLVVEYTFFGGNCPVQAEGTFNGTPFSFRARGRVWKVGVGGEKPGSKPDWSYEEVFGDGSFDAGRMSEQEANGFIRQSAKLWLNKVKKI